MGYTYKSDLPTPLSYQHLDDNWAETDTAIPEAPVWSSSVLSMLGQKVWHKLISTPENVFYHEPSADFMNIAEVVNYSVPVLSLSDGSNNSVTSLPVTILSEGELAGKLFDIDSRDFISSSTNMVFNIGTGGASADMLRLVFTVTDLGDDPMTQLIPNNSDNLSINYISTTPTAIGNLIMLSDNVGYVTLFNSTTASVATGLLEVALQPLDSTSCIGSYRFINTLLNDIGGGIGFAGSANYVNDGVSYNYTGGVAFECIGTKSATWSQASMLSGLTACTVVVGLGVSENRDFQAVGGVDEGSIISFIDGAFDITWRFVCTETYTGFPAPDDYIVFSDFYFPTNPSDINVPTGMTLTVSNNDASASHLAQDISNYCITWEDIGGGQVTVEVYSQGSLLAYGTATGTLPTDIILNPDNNRNLTAFAIEYVRVFNRKLTTDEMKIMARGLQTIYSLDIASEGFVNPMSYFSLNYTPLGLDIATNGVSLGSLVFNSTAQWFECDMFTYPTTDFTMNISRNNNLGLQYGAEGDGVWTLYAYNKD